MASVNRIGLAMFALLAVLCSASFATAAPDLHVGAAAPSSFGDGERIYFNYTIMPSENMEVTFMPSIVCDGNAVAPFKVITVNLSAGQEYTRMHTDFLVGDQIKPGNCVASIVVLDNGKPTENRASATFTINTLPVLETRFLTCADAECTHPKKIFMAGETVYINGAVKNGGPIAVESNDAAFSNGRAALPATLGYHRVLVVSSSPAYKNAPSEYVEYVVLEKHARIKLKNFAVKEKDPTAIKDTDPMAISTGNRIEAAVKE